MIWMDAILNIAYIHRQRYQAAAAEKEILFFYHCLKNQLETKDSAFKNKTVERDSFPELISWANKLLSGYKAEDCKKIFNIDLPDLSEESFKGLFYVRSGKYRKAIRIFKNLTAPENKATQYIRFATIGLKARYLLATCYMALAEYSKAEKILEKLRDTLENARKKRTFPEDPERSDSEPDGRIEVDLGYCYMQKGEYQKAINIYKNIYGNGKDSNNPEFNLMQMKRQHRIMGLNNYAASCILSADEESEGLTLEEKMETARRIFIYLNSDKMVNTGEKKEDQNHDDPETSLLKGYYTICTGADPEGEELNENVLQAYRKSFKESDFQSDRILPYLMAHKYFCDACRVSEAFSARYELMDEKGSGDRGKYRNEVERISAYLVNLVKIARLNNMLEESERTDLIKRLTVTQKEYLTHGHIEKYVK